jgi:hypothetical protein
MTAREISVEDLRSRGDDIAVVLDVRSREKFVEGMCRCGESAVRRAERGGAPVRGADRGDGVPLGRV